MHSSPAVSRSPINTPAHQCHVLTTQHSNATFTKLEQYPRIQTVIAQGCNAKDCSCGLLEGCGIKALSYQWLHNGCQHFAMAGTGQSISNLQGNPPSQTICEAYSVIVACQQVVDSVKAGI
jgi:hypothetical protein